MIKSIKIEESWKKVLYKEFEKNYMKELKEFLIHEKKEFPGDYQMMFENQNNFFLQQRNSEVIFHAASTKEAVDVMKLIKQIKYSNNILD